MNELEKRLREDRTRDAVKENLMGMNGKLGIICKNLGYPIYRQGGGDLYESTEMEDIFAEEGEMSTMEMGGSICQLGWGFDGLSRGMHIEIKCFEYKAEIIATYKGYEVYRESSGELEGYAPFDSWHNMVNNLYATAKKKEKENKTNMEHIIAEEIGKKQLSYLQELRLKWGI